MTLEPVAVGQNFLAAPLDLVRLELPAITGIVGPGQPAFPLANAIAKLPAINDSVGPASVSA